jgi:hypothetical protein
MVRAWQEAQLELARVIPPLPPVRGQPEARSHPRTLRRLRPWRGWKTLTESCKRRPAAPRRASSGRRNESLLTPQSDALMRVFLDSLALRCIEPRRNGRPETRDGSRVFPMRGIVARGHALGYGRVAVLFVVSGRRNSELCEAARDLPVAPEPSGRGQMPVDSRACREGRDGLTLPRRVARNDELETHGASSGDRAHLGGAER